MKAPLKVSIYTALFLLLNACIDNTPEAQAFKSKLTANQWKEPEFSLMGGLSPMNWTWTFTEDGRFTQSHKFSNYISMVDDQTIIQEEPVQTEINRYGTYSIQNKITMNSGHSAFELDLYFTDIHDPDTEITPDPLTLIKLDTAFIRDDALYFGNPREVGNCENELDTPTDEPIYKQFDGVTSASTLNTTLNCYGRPTSINFYIPHEKFEHVR